MRQYATAQRTNRAWHDTYSWYTKYAVMSAVPRLPSPTDLATWSSVGMVQNMADIKNSGALQTERHKLKNGGNVNVG